jgi:uncharacterized protein YidB (DUF937 family)
MQQMAQDSGLDAQSLSGGLAELLPQMIDRVTPNGQTPDGGLDDALGMLAKLSR